jgi:hypothetical protein
VHQQERTRKRNTLLPLDIGVDAEVVDYFTPRILQSSIIREYNEPIGPVNSTGIVGNTLTTTEFNVAAATDLYRVLNNSYHEIEIKVVTAAGADTGADDPVEATNLMLHSLFSKVRVNLS